MNKQRLQQKSIKLTQLVIDNSDQHYSKSQAQRMINQTYQKLSNESKSQPYKKPKHAKIDYEY